MRLKHWNDTQRAFSLTYNYSDTAPREAAWISREAERSIENRGHINRYQADRPSADQARESRSGQ